MSYVKYESLAITTTTSSGVDATSALTYNGQLHAVKYTPSTTATPSTGGTMTITAARTGISLLVLANLGSTAAGVYFPRKGTVLSTDGVTASTGSGMMPLFNEQINVSFSSGSTAGTKNATLEFFIV